MIKNIINRFFSKKILKRSLYTSVITVMTVSYIYCYDSYADIETSNIQSEIITGLDDSKITKETMEVININKTEYKEQNTVQNIEVTKKPMNAAVVTEKEIIKPEPVRKNTLYYINDNGYKRYLDNKYQDYLYKMCVKYDIEKYYTLLLAQMYHESGFQVDVISKTKDYGLMQINKCNHKWLGEILGNDNFLDPYNNIEAGVYMMSMFLHKYNDAEKALVCYNKGESAVRKGTYSTSYSKGVINDMNLLIKLD